MVMNYILELNIGRHNIMLIILMMTITGIIQLKIKHSDLHFHTISLIALEARLTLDSEEGDHYYG